jgi:hypothetical protein
MVKFKARFTLEFFIIKIPEMEFVCFVRKFGAGMVAIEKLTVSTFTSLIGIFRFWCCATAVETLKRKRNEINTIRMVGNIDFYITAYSSIIEFPFRQDVQFYR